MKRYRLRRTLVLSICMLTLLIASPVLAGTITQISLANFNNPQVLDFETAPLGTISGNDSLFSNIGISNITATSSPYGDYYESYANSSRALWYDGNNLTIVDPDTGFYDGGITYTLDFSSLHTKVGIGVQDQRGLFSYSFFNGATNVGNFNLVSPSNDLFQAYLMNDMAFNRLTINYDGPSGFALDNITLEGQTAAATTPEPSTMVLLSSGLLGMGLYNWKKRKAVKE